MKYLLWIPLLCSLAFGQGIVVAPKTVIGPKTVVSPGVAPSIPLLAHTTASINGTASTPNISGIGATLIVIFAHDIVAITPPTDNSSNTYTPLTSYNASTDYYIQAYYICGPTVTGAMNFTPHGTAPKIEVMLFSGTLTSSCADGSGTGLVGGNFATSWQPGSLTPAGSGELFVTGLSYAGTVAPTISGGCFTTALDTNLANGWTGSDAYCINAGSSAQNPTWADIASTYGVPSMAAFIP